MSTCYYPDGTISTDTPCNTTAIESACCAPNAICLGGGVCWDGAGLARGACTSKDWTDPACFQHCKDASPSTGAPLQFCGISNYNAMYACYNQSTYQCVASNNGRFALDTAAASLVLRPTQLAALNAEATSTSTSTSTSSRLGNAGAASSSIGYAASSSRSIANPASASSSIANAAGASSGIGNVTTNGVARAYTAGDMAAVGAGVGVPLALALAAALIMLRREKRRSERKEAEKTQWIWRDDQGDSVGKEELQTHERPVELDGNRGTYELPVYGP
ncbi:Uu.00g094630.m01.CDS01 [Anthostomella pinea]|uniref:Uu.00g094630.m01.CDS01 n=1 Tax=Anthostomella pinea TaxID=933095 RepID=A0AAI8VPD8_9PEZI|nr:Uu.00g094630.m01.CDS01 [Anthostomella pinea]